MRDRTLSEELAIVLTGKRGHWITSSPDIALAGCAMAEFILAGTLGLEGEGKKARLVRCTDKVPSHPFHRSVLEAMERRGFGRKPSTLLQAGAGRKRTQALRAKLAAEGDLLTERRRFLFVPFTAYPVADPNVREEIVEELRAAIASEDQVPEGETVLIALIKALGLERRVFGGRFVSRHRQRIKGIVNEAGASVEAVRVALIAIQSAATIVVLAAASSS